MIRFLRFSFVVPPLLVALVAVSGCGGDDDSNGDGGDSSPTPFIAPEGLTTADAVALLDEVEALVLDPNPALLAVAQVGEAQAQERSLRILNGADDASGLDDVRASLVNGDRVGAGEYLFNVVRDDAQPFSDPDTNEIREETLDEVDLTSTFDEDHSDGMVVSGVYKDAVTKMMQLWYGLLGVPPEDEPGPS